MILQMARKGKYAGGYALVIRTILQHLQRAADPSPMASAYPLSRDALPWAQWHNRVGVTHTYARDGWRPGPTGSPPNLR